MTAPKILRKLRPWSLAVAGRRKPEVKEESEGSGSSASRSGETLNGGRGARSEVELRGYGSEDGGERERKVGERYEWEVDSGGEDAEEEEQMIDSYSWIDPSIIGSEGLRATPLNSPPNELETNEVIPPSRPVPPPLPNRVPQAPDPPQRPAPRLDPSDSYNLLLAYQSSRSTATTTSSTSQYQDAMPAVSSATHHMPFAASSDGTHLASPNPDWHEMVDASVLESLPRSEVRRQGLWWELIGGEMEYVRDLRIVCEHFVNPLRTHSPPLLEPESRLNAFIAEVFSTAPQLYLGHAKLLDRLLERQRTQWPLVETATDVLLAGYLEMVDMYEVYMKNYPFAEARVRRETSKNPPFRAFLNERNTNELTRRRDVSVFLSRPITRIPRVLMLLEALKKATPDEHPDMEDIPAVESVLSGALKGSQPGIESAEAKIKLWNVAERLLFKKGEIIELDIGEPKRTLVHSGYVFRRIRSETNWHGWQDLHAFLLDNYFLLTRDEEHGSHVVVSRPIHLDFLTLVSADGAPERRYDCVTKYNRRPGGNMLEPIFQPERLMFPLTIAVGTATGGRTYTLCASTQAAREQWRERIDGAKVLRKFDVENNRMFAVHNLYVPPEIASSLVSSDTFGWLGREAVAFASGKSVWVGWRRDSQSFRELIQFTGTHVSSVAAIAEFGWLLVVQAGALFAFSLNEMMPTHDPSTWHQLGRMQGVQLSAPDHTVAFCRIGTTKGRLLVVYATHAKNAHQTVLNFQEPLLPPLLTPEPFRPFAKLVLPGYATELAFFRQTIAVVTEKSFVVAEPGNPTHNAIPTFPSTVAPNATIVRLVAGQASRPMSMFQVAENEFVLVYDWGACFVTKYGEVSRNGAFLRWNLSPTYAVFRPPHLLLFDEVTSRAEVRDVHSGRVVEVLEHRGMKPIRLAGLDKSLLALVPGGLIEIVETYEL